MKDAVYCHIFNEQKKDWVKKFEVLAKIRNPIAHNNEYFLNDSDKNLAIKKVVNLDLDFSANSPPF